MKTSKLKGFFIRLTIEAPDGTAHRYLRRNKKSILSVLSRWDHFKKAKIHVQYTPKYHNDGVYATKEELVNAYQIFTEKELILDILEYNK